MLNRIEVEEGQHSGRSDNSTIEWVDEPQIRAMAKEKVLKALLEVYMELMKDPVRPSRYFMSLGYAIRCFKKYGGEENE